MRLLYIFIILGLFSCKYEKYEPSASLNPLAECIDGHAKFILDGKEYEYECDGYDLMGYVSLDEMNAQSGNDCWGWTDPSSGKEYALMGLDNGTAIIDISIPTDPLYLGKIFTNGDPNDRGKAWRDLKVFKDYVFIVSEIAGHGMQVFDLKQLRGLDSKQNFTADYISLDMGKLTILQLIQSLDMHTQLELALRYLIQLALVFMLSTFLTQHLLFLSFSHLILFPLTLKEKEHTHMMLKSLIIKDRIVIILGKKFTLEVMKIKLFLLM